VSFVIGHRGMERLPHLLSTIESIAGQRDVGVECLVVEQDTQTLVRAQLPGWVRYLHTPLPYPGMPYCRSWALNVGACYARGRVLVLHDNDMLVPTDYAREILRRADAGFEAINLKRFIFYLVSEHTRGAFAGTAALDWAPPSAIVQNLEAGGSIAITREAYARIGGMDESFVGWGGEDNEFWERAQTRRVWPYGYLPIVHLWHPAQPRKQDPANPNSRRQALRSAIPPDQRIRELVARPYGDPAGLSVDWPEPRPR
jgi:hypothetical protein